MTLTQLIKYADISLADMAKLIGATTKQMKARASDKNECAVPYNNNEGFYV